MLATTVAIEAQLQTPHDSPVLETARLNALRANASGDAADQAKAILYRLLNSDLRGMFFNMVVIPTGYLDAPPPTYRRVKEAVVYADALSGLFEDILAELEMRKVDEAYLTIFRALLIDAAPQSRVAGTAALAVVTAILRT